jgi:RNA polymerase sigma factor (sigma-70 family)
MQNVRPLAPDQQGALELPMSDHRSYKRWTDEEDQALEEYGKIVDGRKVTGGELSKRLSRPEISVYRRISILKKRRSQDAPETKAPVDPFKIPKSQMGLLRLEAPMKNDDPLTPEEMKRLGDEASCGAKAAARMLLSIRNFIYKTAIKHAYFLNQKTRAVPVDPEELAAEYNYRMLQSLQAGAYDPSRGSLTTFAGWRLRNFYHLTSMNESRDVRNVSRTFSLSAPYPDDDTSPADTLVDKGAYDPAALLVEEELFEKVRYVLGRLSKSDQDLLRKFFEEGKEAKDVALEMELSRQRVYQLVERALRNARREFERCGFETSVA